MPHIDNIDAHLLRLLQEGGRTSQHDLAQEVGLSAPAVGERLRKLEERQVIRGFSAIVDPKRVGFDITAFIAVGINGSRYFEPFIERVAECSQILECHSITGQGSHLLKVRVRDTTALERILATIQAWPGVQWTTTSLVLSTIKETSRLELELTPSP